MAANTNWRAGQQQKLNVGEQQPICKNQFMYSNQQNGGQKVIDNKTPRDAQKPKGNKHQVMRKKLMNNKT